MSHSVPGMMVQVLVRKHPIRPAVAKSPVMAKCGKFTCSSHADSKKSGKSSRRNTLIAGMSAVTVSEALSAGEASAASSAADAYEIPETQQCLECAGSGVISCAFQAPDSIRILFHKTLGNYATRCWK